MNASVNKGQRKKIFRDLVLPRLRETLFDENLFNRPFTKKYFEYVKYFFKLGQIPFFRNRLPEFSPGKSSISWIPINEDIQGAEGIALPEEILDRLIEKAGHRVIVNFCGCRIAVKCNDYPRDIGCLMMGEAALMIPEKSRREVSVDEAKAHVRKAIEAGLIPITGKARIDNDIFMIPDDGKLLTVCLCCDCCCITRFSQYATPDIMDGIQPPVEGLVVEVTDDCIGCGECVSKCYINAISLKGDRAVLGDMCRICGRCVQHCPQKAIKLTLDNPNAVDDVIQRIESHVDF